MDIERYYAEAKVSASTLTLHHTILHQAFRKAAKDRLIATNIAADLDGKPRRTREKVSEDALKHAWSATEARAFLAAAKLAGPQPGAFYALALDSGAEGLHHERDADWVVDWHHSAWAGHLDVLVRNFFLERGIRVG